VRAITNVRDLATFRRFVAPIASHHGQVLNKTDLAAPLGVSQPTIAEWLRVLEVTVQVIMVQSYFENFGKRMIKSPKMYVSDSGMACHLLGITSQKEFERSPFVGSLFESFVAAEIVKSQVNRGQRREIYYFRDQQGPEVDFLFPDAHGRTWLVECKASKTVLPSMTGPLLSLHKSMGRTSRRAAVVHRPSSGPQVTRALAPGVEALDARAFIREIAA